MITVQLQGGLGNQMFEYACGRALALKNHASLTLEPPYRLDRIPIKIKKFTYRPYALDVFNIQASISHSKRTYWHWGFSRIKSKIIKVQIKGLEKKFSFDSSIISLTGDIRLVGEWQSSRYFEGYEDAIRKDFNLRNPLPEETQLLLEKIGQGVSAGIHIRRGDFVRHAFHDVGLDENYYKKALLLIHEKYSVDKVYVFSDDIEWCKEHVQFPVETVFVGQEHAGKHGEGHMILMSHCQHSIISNSSFSWWAAWLNNNPQKIVIAPKQWFTDKSIDTTDLIPPEWVRI